MVHAYFASYDTRRFRALSTAAVPGFTDILNNVDYSYETVSKEMTIELSNLDNILAEEYIATIERVTCVAKTLNGNCVQDLDQYTVEFDYRLVDCTRDFNEPSVFIEPETVEDFADSAVNYMDEGRKYYTQYEVGR